MVKRSEIGILGAAWRRSQGVSAESKMMGLSSRVRRAASSLQMQSEEPVVASYGPAKTAVLTMLSRCSWRARIASRRVRRSPTSSPSSSPPPLPPPPSGPSRDARLRSEMEARTCVARAEDGARGDHRQQVETPLRAAGSLGRATRAPERRLSGRGAAATPCPWAADGCHVAPHALHALEALGDEP